MPVHISSSEVRLRTIIVIFVGGVADEEAQIFFHVGDGGFEATVRGSDAGVVVEGLGFKFASMANVTRGNMRGEVVRRAVEITRVHLKGHEDVFRDVDFEVVTGEALDDLAEENVAEI